MKENPSCTRRRMVAHPVSRRNSMRLLSFIIAFALTCFVINPTSNAQLSATRGWQVEYFNWKFHAAVSDYQVIGFLAVLDESHAVGDNVRVVWIEQLPDGEVGMWGWSGQNTAEILTKAAKWSSDRSSSPYLWSSDPELWIAANQSGSSEDPTLIDSGLFVSDAISLASFAPEIQPVLAEALASDGYEAAPTLSAVSTILAGTSNANSALMSANDLFDHLLYLSETDLYGSSSISQPVAGEWACRCPCTTTYTTTWVAATPSFVDRGSVRLCMYVGTHTCTENCRGLYFFSCLACITSSACGTTTIYGDLQWDPTSPCPAANDPTYPPTEYPLKPPS
jgi:hypothetical protein